MRLDRCAELNRGAVILGWGKDDNTNRESQRMREDVYEARSGYLWIGRPWQVYQ